MKSKLIKTPPRKLFRVDTHVCIGATGVILFPALAVDRGCCFFCCRNRVALLFHFAWFFHIAQTGLLFDANLLVDCAKQICMNYRDKFSCVIPLENLADELASVLHQQTRSAGMSTPLQCEGYFRMCALWL